MRQGDGGEGGVVFIEVELLGKVEIDKVNKERDGEEDGMSLHLLYIVILPGLVPGFPFAFLVFEKDPL